MNSVPLYLIFVFEGNIVTINGLIFRCVINTTAKIHIYFKLQMKPVKKMLDAGCWVRSA
jgi:hypothetical protein